MNDFDDDDDPYGDEDEDYYGELNDDDGADPEE